MSLKTFFLTVPSPQAMCEKGKVTSRGCKRPHTPQKPANSGQDSALPQKPANTEKAATGVAPLVADLQALDEQGLLSAVVPAECEKLPEQEEEEAAEEQPAATEEEKAASAASSGGGKAARRRPPGCAAPPNVVL